MHHDSEQARLLEPLSTKWIEDAAGVSRDTVAAWRRGRKPRADQWERFTTALDAWRAGLAGTTKPPPTWAAEMREELLAAIREAGWTPEERAALHAIDATARPTSAGADDPIEEGEPAPAHGQRHRPQPDQ